MFFKLRKFLFIKIRNHIILAHNGSCQNNGGTFDVGRRCYLIN